MQPEYSQKLTPHGHHGTVTSIWCEDLTLITFTSWKVFIPSSSLGLRWPYFLNCCETTRRRSMRYQRHGEWQAKTTMELATRKEDADCLHSRVCPVQKQHRKGPNSPVQEYTGPRENITWHNLLPIPPKQLSQETRGAGLQARQHKCFCLFSMEDKGPWRSSFQGPSSNESENVRRSMEERWPRSTPPKKDKNV